jgi:hypothetical protein
MTKSYSFSEYVEELVLISEIIEIPGMRQKRDDLIRVMLEVYPDQCEELGISKD